MERDALGPADVSDERLAAMVAQLLHVDDVTLLDSRVEPVDYDQVTITTGARWWVSGHAVCAGERAAYRFFVKVVHSFERSPLFAMVPEEHRALAIASVPWRTEAAVYCSDLAERLPDGLTLPRALAVVELDEHSTALWLEAVPLRAVAWDRARYERAAHLLGRLSGSERAAPLAGLRDVPWTLSTYAGTRLAVQVVPLLVSEEVWQHPLCAPFDPQLRDRLRATAAAVPELAAEADALPYLPSHGDACPNNLLAGEGDDLVMIDFGFAGAAPVGFDLGQLLVGEVQLGRRGTGDLAELGEALVAAYAAGLRDEGRAISPAQVRRGHALCLVLMTGLTALPFDLFDGPVDERTLGLAAARAELARHALDLVESTAGQRS